MGSHAARAAVLARAAAIVVCVGGYSPAPVIAKEFGYGVGYIGEHSNNVTLAPVNQQDEWINSALAGFFYRDITPTIEMSAAGTLEYRDYAHDVYADETLGTFGGLLLWNILPRQFTWTIEDAYDQTIVNNTLPGTPDNRTGTNVISTGPDGYLRFSPVSTLQLGARYENLNVENTGNDSTSSIGYAHWLYQTSSITTLSANYEAEQVDSVNDLAFEDYTRRDAYLSLHRLQVNSELTADIGRSRVERESQQDVTGDLYRFGWLARLSSDLTVGVSANQEFGSTLDDLLSAARFVTSPSAVSGEPSAIEPTLTGELYKDQNAEAFFRYLGIRHEVTVSAYWQDTDFETSSDDKDERGLRANVQRTLAPDLVLDIGAVAANTEYPLLVREDDDIEAEVGLGYHATRYVTYGVSARLFSRDSSDPTFSYDETRIQFSIIYNSAPLLPALGPR